VKPRVLGALGALLALRLGLDTWRYLQVPGRLDNGEERYSATVGWYLWSAGLWDQALALQYKTFCGGCTVHALTAGVDAVWAWKGLALVWTALIFVAGVYALFRREGVGAAFAFALVYCLPPPGVTDLALMRWGNHHEGGLFVLAALAGGPLTGLAVGLGWSFARSTAHAAVLLFAARGSRWPAVVGLAAGASLSLLPAARGDAGNYALTTLLPQGLGGAVARAGALLDPSQLGPRLFPGVHATWPAGIWIAAFIGSLVVLVWRRRWAVPALVAAFVVLWSVSGAAIPRMPPDGGVLQARYHAPWMLLGLVAMAAAAPYSRGALLVVGLLPTLYAWTTLRRGPIDLDVLREPVVDHVGFASVAFRRIPAERLATAHSEDPHTEVSLRRLEGYAAADAVRLGADPVATRAALSGEAVSAYWQARTGTEVDLAGVAADPDPVAAGRGAAWNLRFARVSLESVRGTPMAAAGAGALLQSCTKRGATCVIAGLKGPDAEALAYGAGLSCQRACDGIATAMPVALRPAWEAGRADPLSAAKEPFRLEKAPAGMGAPGTPSR
jgi:hypothetical protein